MSVVSHAIARQFTESDGTLLVKFAFTLSSGETVTDGYRRYPADADLTAARQAIVPVVEAHAAAAEAAALLGDS